MVISTGLVGDDRYFSTDDSVFSQEEVAVIRLVTLDLWTEIQETETKMRLPEYVSIEQVQRVCRELGLRDWTQLTETEVQPEEAGIIQAEVGGEAMQISLDEFRRGLEVELEHGLQFPDANVTNNHPILTGKIVLAHLKETLDYYTRLEVAELEGDLLKASIKGDVNKLAVVYKKLLAAKAALSEREIEQQNS